MMESNITFNSFTLSPFDNYTETNVTSGLFAGNVSSTPAAVQGSGRGGGASYFLPWDNPKNVMTKKMSDDITSALQCYVFPIVTVFGIVGNILSLIVLMQKKLRKSTTTIVLIGLAVSDILFLVTNMVRKSSCIIERYDRLLSAEITAFSFFYMFYLKTAFSRVSTFIVVLISVERFIAVVFPLKVKSIVTKRRMVAAVVFIFVLVLGSLAGLPPQYTHTFIRGQPYISQTKFALENKDSLKAYNEFFLPIAFRYIPVLLVLILNIVIIVIVNKSQRFQGKQAREDPKRKDEQKKITRMLLSVAIIFLICLLPGDILLFCSTVIDGFAFFGTYHNLFMALSDICLLFEMINSSVNFITYMILNRNFFEVYVQLFCGCFRYIQARRQSSKGSETQSSNPTKDTRISDRWLKGLKSQGRDSEINDSEKSLSELSHSKNEQELPSVDGHVNDGYNE